MLILSTGVFDRRSQRQRQLYDRSGQAITLRQRQRRHGGVSRPPREFRRGQQPVPPPEEQDRCQTEQGHRQGQAVVRRGRVHDISGRRLREPGLQAG